MPFKSIAQAGFMHEHPDILGKAGLAEWDAATKGKKLPQHTAEKTLSQSHHDMHEAIASMKERRGV